MTRPTYTPRMLQQMRTLCVGQCCSLKIEGDDFRVWLCRVEGGVTVERYNTTTGRWEQTSGGCYEIGGAS